MLSDKNIQYFPCISDMSFMKNRRGGYGFYEENGKKMCSFKVYAPNADSVSLCGDFCGWDKGIPMTKKTDGVWEACSENVKLYDCYKFKIQRGGRAVYKSDPYAIHFETPPRNASKIYYMPENFHRGDERWLKERREYVGKIQNKPLNIYRLHLEFWKKKSDGNPYSYREAALELASCAKRMGYTHIRLASIVEHTQKTISGQIPTGLFAPTSRFGTPRDFVEFTDILHRAGLGVIVELPFEKVSTEEQGMCLFDGTPLYEKEYGKAHLDTNKQEVFELLTLCALWWLEQLGADGIHILYDGDREFAKKLYRAVKKRAYDALIIADGELGDEFDFSVTDISEVVFGSACPADKLISETGRNIIPLSFDKLVLRKAICKDDACSLKLLCSYAAFLMAFPGKKLTVMGNEIGQTEMPDIGQTVDWRLLDEEQHKRTVLFFEKLNCLYLSDKTFWENDSDIDFHIVCRDKQNGIFAFMRYDNSKNGILCIFNTDATVKSGFSIACPEGEYSVIFSAGDEEYKKSSYESKCTYSSENTIAIAKDCGMTVDIPACTCIILKYKK